MTGNFRLLFPAVSNMPMTGKEGALSTKHQQSENETCQLTYHILPRFSAILSMYRWIDMIPMCRPNLLFVMMTLLYPAILAS